MTTLQHFKASGQTVDRLRKQTKTTTSRHLSSLTTPGGGKSGRSGHGQRELPRRDNFEGAGWGWETSASSHSHPQGDNAWARHKIQFARLRQAWVFVHRSCGHTFRAPFLLSCMYYVKSWALPYRQDCLWRKVRKSPFVLEAAAIRWAAEISLGLMYADPSSSSLSSIVPKKASEPCSWQRRSAPGRGLQKTLLLSWYRPHSLEDGLKSLRRCHSPLTDGPSSDYFGGETKAEPVK